MANNTTCHCEQITPSTETVHLNILILKTLFITDLLFRNLGNSCSQNISFAKHQHQEPVHIAKLLIL